MAKLLFFEENEGQKCVFRFVKSFSNGGWFRKKRIEYTLLQSEAYCFSGNEPIPTFITEMIKIDFPDARVVVMEQSEFLTEYAMNRFWVISRLSNNSKEEYFCGRINRNEITYSGNLSEVRMILSETSATETLRTIQQTAMDKVSVRQVYLNLTNELLTPIFMITCTNKKDGTTRFFKKLDGNRVRAVVTSFAAAKFTYEDVLVKFTYLQQHNKNFLYAVLPVFKDNVSAMNIESYIKENKVSRMVAMDLQLKYLNKKVL